MACCNVEVKVAILAEGGQLCFTGDVSKQVNRATDSKGVQDTTKSSNSQATVKQGVTFGTSEAVCLSGRAGRSDFK